MMMKPRTALEALESHHQRVPLDERIRRVGSGAAGSSDDYMAAMVLRVAAMPLSEYFAGVDHYDSYSGCRASDGFAWFRTLLDCSAEAMRLHLIPGLYGIWNHRHCDCDDQDWAAHMLWSRTREVSLVDGSTSVARAACLLDALMRVCPRRLRRHSRSECNASDGLLTAAEWLGAPLERSFVDYLGEMDLSDVDDFDVDKFLAETNDSEGTMRSASRRLTGDRDDDDRAGEETERLGLGERLRRAGAEEPGDGPAYRTPSSPLFAMGHGMRVDNLFDSYDLLLGHGRMDGMRALAARRLRELGVKAGTPCGEVLVHQTTSASATADYGDLTMALLSAPDTSGMVDHGLDLHRLMVVRPMALLHLRGLA